ncbi:MAG: glycosyltransferase family 4 protein [Nitrospinales bacterium]
MINTSSEKKTRKLRVLMFGPSRNYSGGISNVVNNWIETGIGEMIQLHYISTLEISVPGQYIFKIGNALKAYFHFIVHSRHPIDIIHIHMSSYMSFFRKWFIFKYSKWKNIKTIIHIHGSEFELFFNNSNGLVKRLIVNLFDTADAIIVLSKTWKNFVQSISANPHIYILYNGSSLKKFSGKIPNNGKIKVLFMGRLGQRKGAFDLLEAFGKAIKTVPDLQLILGGDGEVEQIREMVSQKGLKNQVIVPGWISGEEKISTFKSCDIFVLPSFNEGLPGSILEAMAVGVPVISTPVGGIPEAVIENRNGFLINPGDVDSLYKKIVKLGQDKNLREMMGKESHKIIKEKFDIESIVSKLGEIYAEVVAR